MVLLHLHYCASYEMMLCQLDLGDVCTCDITVDGTDFPRRKVQLVTNMVHLIVIFGFCCISQSTYLCLACRSMDVFCACACTMNKISRD